MKLTIRALKRLYYGLFFSKTAFYSTFISFISILLGFFIANTLATMLSQTGDWGILSSGVMVGLTESINRIVYNNKKNLKSDSFFHEGVLRLVSLINNVKIGIVYGLFVEAFKLGS